MLPVRARELPPMSYDAPLSSTYWDDDGTPEFKEIMARLEREGVILER